MCVCVRVCMGCLLVAFFFLIYTHTCTRTHAHAHVHAHTHTCTQSHTHTHSHTHTRTHTDGVLGSSLLPSTSVVSGSPPANKTTLASVASVAVPSINAIALTQQEQQQETHSDAMQARSSSVPAAASAKALNIQYSASYSHTCSFQRWMLSACVRSKEYVMGPQEPFEESELNHVGIAPAAANKMTDTSKKNQYTPCSHQRQKGKEREAGKDKGWGHGRKGGRERV